MLRKAIRIGERIKLFIKRLLKRWWKEKSPIPPRPEPRKKPPDYIHLSLFKNLCDKYNLDHNQEDSFSKLRKHLFNDGKKYVKEKIKDIINGEHTPMEKAELLIKSYKDLKEKKQEINFELGVNDDKSPKIYREAVKPYLKQYNLEDLAEKDLKEAIFQVLQWIYNAGVKTVLGRLDINFEYLEKNINESGKDDMVEIEIQNIKEKIEKVDKN